ncbi:phage tail protein [Clostridium botulinum]|nr:phage tail protein [Clostridium botulinum]MCD3329473.1 phage tail protein [Clostridium botulinum D/C]
MGTKLNITKLQVGDGGGSYYNPTEEQEQLKNKVWEGNIGSITVDKDNKNWIVIETLLPGDIGGFMIREAGIFDSNGNLIAVGKYPETYKPITSQGSLKDLKIKMILEISNTSTVTLKIDPTVILATQKDIKYLNKQIEDFTNEIGNIKDLKTTNKDNLVESVNELFTNAGNGKDSLYSAITGKKVTPRSKNFEDLTNAIKDIKLGQGNAQASEVLQGRTFTNDSGVMQTGTIPNMGSKEIEPKIYSQELGKGYYEKVKLKGINDLDNDTMKEVVKTIAPKIKDDLPSIIQSAGILPFKTWKWSGDSYYGNHLNNDVPYKSMKVPFEIKILFTKCDGYRGGNTNGVITQTWVDKDFFKTTIGEHFIFIPPDLVHYSMQAQNNFNYIIGC